MPAMLWEAAYYTFTKAETKMHSKFYKSNQIKIHFSCMSLWTCRTETDESLGSIECMH